VGKVSSLKPIRCPTSVVRYQPEEEGTLGWGPRFPYTIKSLEGDRALERRLIGRLSRVFPENQQAPNMLVRFVLLQNHLKQEISQVEKITNNRSREHTMQVPGPSEIS
jgi:hypothetical protein